MPAHSVLISPAQGLGAGCATATEPDTSSVVNITSPDRIPAISGSSEIQKGRIAVMSESRPRRLERRCWDPKRFVKMAQSVARKGAPVLCIADPIWVFGVILTPMPPLPVGRNVFQKTGRPNARIDLPGCRKHPLILKREHRDAIIVAATK
jgi:hypothetical protein